MSITGPFKPFHLAKLAVANSSTFQGIVGVANATDALGYIEKWYGETEQRPMPRCLIMQGDGYTKMRAGTGHFKCENPQVMVQFEFEIPSDVEAESYEEEGDWMMSQVGAIMTDIQDAHNNRTQILGENPLDILGWSLFSGPEFIPHEEREILSPDSGQTNQNAWVTIVSLTFGG